MALPRMQGEHLSRALIEFLMRLTRGTQSERIRSDAHLSFAQIASLMGNVNPSIKNKSAS